MSPRSVFPSPSELLIHDHVHLKDLFAEYERFVPREREKKARMIRRIEEELRRHFRIEERLLYPSLLTLHSRAVQELVRSAQGEHGAILKTCAELSHLEHPQQQERMMKALFKQVVGYAEFEEKRLLPWAKALPGVTLREMSLEIEELRGEEHGTP
jgi:hypothetical protein